MKSQTAENRQLNDRSRRLTTRVRRCASDGMRPAAPSNQRLLFWYKMLNTIGTVSTLILY